MCLCVLKGSLEGQISSWRYWLPMKSKWVTGGQG